MKLKNNLLEVKELEKKYEDDISESDNFQQFIENHDNEIDDSDNEQNQDYHDDMNMEVELAEELIEEKL